MLKDLYSSLCLYTEYYSSFPVVFFVLDSITSTTSIVFVCLFEMSSIIFIQVRDFLLVPTLFTTVYVRRFSLYLNFFFRFISKILTFHIIDFTFWPDLPELSSCLYSLLSQSFKLLSSHFYFRFVLFRSHWTPCYSAPDCVYINHRFFLLYLFLSHLI